MYDKTTLWLLSHVSMTAWGLLAHDFTFANIRAQVHNRCSAISQLAREAALALLRSIALELAKSTPVCDQLTYSSCRQQLLLW